MGGETSKPESKRVEEERIEHPHFLHAEIVDVDQKGDQLIKMRVPVHGEKTIKDWETGLNEIRAFDRESLLLPAYHSFESQGFCGTSGMLNVHTPLPRYSTLTTPISSPSRSRIDGRGKRRRVSARQSYGTCSTPSAPRQPSSTKKAKGPS